MPGERAEANRLARECLALPGAGMEVYFSPDGGIRRQLLRAIQDSHQQIDVAVYQLKIHQPIQGRKKCFRTTSDPESRCCSVRASIASALGSAVLEDCVWRIQPGSCKNEFIIVGQIHF